MKEKTPVSAGREHLFLREEELRAAQDLLFFGYRDFTAGADAMLAEIGLGRAHHRVLHFVGRRPGLTVGELLTILDITKQSLGRVLTPLVEGGYIEQAMRTASAIGDDKLQQASRGTVVPDSFTHGSSAQRQRWFMTGFRTGSMQACDTFRNQV